MDAPAGSRRALGVLLAGAALTLVALMFDASPLFVPGIAFLLLGAGAWTWVTVVARGSRIDRVLSTDRVVEDDPFESMIQVRGGMLGVAGAEVHDPMSGAPVLLRSAGRSATIRVLARFDRRGLRTVPAPTLVIRDPLMLAERHGECLAEPGQVLVLPRTERVRWRSGSSGERFAALGARARANMAVEVEVDGLRPYQPGTPASRIHWPAYARGAGLLERRLRADDDLRPLVVLDGRGDVPLEALDAAVRAAASLTLELARAGGCLLLVPGERRPVAVEPDLATWPGAIARLALVEGGASAPAPMLSNARGRRGAVLYVTAALRERPPASVGYGAVALVMPAAYRPSGARPSFEVSGCCGYVVGRRSRAGEVAA
jgi:uncharacterized protein (DUF58 family)